jgi:ADP-L-glycero-D-manno-heptose 6-epimerase
MIIVTGSSGFIGSNLMKTLMEKGEEVRGVDYIQRDYVSNNSINYLADDFYSRLDLCCDGVTTIFHEGAISSTTETDWRKLWKYNVECTMNLIYFCRDNNINLQYASSASVYGNPSIEEWNNPKKKTNPLNMYAKSKEQIDYITGLILSSRRPSKLLQGLRYFNVYGKNEEHKGDQSSPYHKFTKQLKETGKIKLFEGSKGFYRDFISVEEIIEKKIKILEKGKSGIYDIGTGKPKSFYNVAEEVCMKEGIENPEQYIEWIPMPDNLKEHYQKYSCAILDHI